MTERVPPLRICHLASGDLWAGAEVMVYELLRELHSVADLQVSAIVLNQGRLARELSAAGIMVRTIEEREHALPSLVRQIRQVLASRSVDIVHAHRYKENLLAWLAGDRAIRLTTQHGLPENLGRVGPRLKQWFNFQLLGRAFDQVVAVSGELGERLRREWQLPAARLTVIANGVPVPARLSRRPQRPLVIGSAGRLVPVKDFPLLIETAALLRHSAEPIRFVVAGDGPQRAQLQELIGRHRLQDDFTMAGEVTDMGAFYRNLDVYINTSRHEGLPMSVLEAMAHALPVIAPAVGGIGEVVRDEREGLLVEGRDAAAFAHACRRMVHDPSFRRQAGEAGRTRVLAEFSTARMAERYRQLYGRLVQGFNPSQPPLTLRGGVDNLPP